MSYGINNFSETGATLLSLDSNFSQYYPPVYVENKFLLPSITLNNILHGALTDGLASKNFYYSILYSPYTAYNDTDFVVFSDSDIEISLLSIGGQTRILIGLGPASFTYYLVKK